MSEAEKRKHRLCFTGHRPEKLHCGEATVCAILEGSIDAAISDGFMTFISGMARGVDLWAALIVLRMKEKEPDVQLVCASPYPGFEGKRHDSWYAAYQRVPSRVMRKLVCRFWLNEVSRQ